MTEVAGVGVEWYTLVNICYINVMTIDTFGCGGERYGLEDRGDNALAVFMNATEWDAYRETPIAKELVRERIRKGLADDKYRNADSEEQSQ